MNRRILSTLAISAALLVPASSAFATDAPTTSTPPTTQVRSCTGAVQHRQAIELRVQAVNLDLQAANARRAEAVAQNNTVKVAKIDARIAKLNARLAKLAQHKAQLDQRCPA